MPLAIAGLALGAGGAALNIIGNNKSQNAINQTRQNANLQQAQLQSQANQVVQKSIKNSTPQTVQSQINKGAADRVSAWQQLNQATTPIASALPATGTDTVTGRAAGRAATAGNAWNTLTADAAAKEGGYGDYKTQQEINNQNANSQLGVINNFSKSDASLLPLETEVASNAGSKLTSWGSILGSLGQLAGVAGATGAFSSAPVGTAAGINAAYNYPGTAAMLNGAGAANTIKNTLGSGLLSTSIYDP